MHFAGCIQSFRQRLNGQALFLAALGALLLLSEVFSSSIQSSLPLFSTMARAALTGFAVLTLLLKCAFYTQYTGRRQRVLIAAVLAYAAFAAWYGGDRWFFLTALLAVGAYGVDLRTALKLYLGIAAAGLVLVQLLHLCTPLIPYKFYCRNWDFGYGHYNGYGARLLGVFLAWAWLRWPRLRWFDWLGLVGLLFYTALAPTSRGAVGAMLILLVLILLQKVLPRFFSGRLWQGVLLALWPLFTAASMACGYLYDPARPDATPFLRRISVLLSGRFEIWHNVFWQTPASVLGGLPTDGDEHHAMDNAYLAIFMNKGILGAVLVAALYLLLLWRLCKNRHTGETLCLCALLFYCLMENKLFLVASNPLFLLLPCVFFWPPDGRLGVVSPPPAPPQNS